MHKNFFTVLKVHSFLVDKVKRTLGLNLSQLTTYERFHEFYFNPFFCNVEKRKNII